MNFLASEKYTLEKLYKAIKEDWIEYPKSIPEKDGWYFVKYEHHMTTLNDLCDYSNGKFYQVSNVRRHPYYDITDLVTHFQIGKRNDTMGIFTTNCL